MFIFRQLFEKTTSTYTYLLGCSRSHRAVLIDPVVEEVETYLKMVEELDVELLYTMETHVHADHVTAASALREKVGSRGVVFRDAEAPCADLMVTDGVLLQVGDLEIQVIETPGHTSGCVSYRAPDRVFTGDALLIGGCGRTDFQSGNAKTLYHSVVHKLFHLPGDTLVFPAHDYKGRTVSTIKEEHATNPRLGGGRSEREFVEIMANLKLPYPKQMERAVPANQSCGREQGIQQG